MFLAAVLWSASDAEATRFHGTVYGPPWNALEGGSVTKIGTPLRPGRHVVAVDPRVIPLGSYVTVWPNPHRWRGVFRAEDIGGAIKGRDVDIFDWRSWLSYRLTWSRTVNVRIVYPVQTSRSTRWRARKLRPRAHIKRVGQAW